MSRKEHEPSRRATTTDDFAFHHFKLILLQHGSLEVLSDINYTSINMAPQSSRKRHITTTSSNPQANKITSYFSTNPQSEHRSIESYAAANDTTAYALNTLSPPVPNEVQSSLLNVGMRVRKAMGEGYKNAALGKTKQAYSAPSTATISMPPATTIGAISDSQTRGLMPMCGMHKIGGLSAQPVYNNNTIGDDDEDWPLSSQESSMTTDSTDSMPARKRSFDDEAEEEDAMADERMQAMASTRTRKFAHLKRTPGRGQHRWNVPAEAEMEFDEAEFLVPEDEEMEL
jgi:hypothetical protein